MKASGLALLWMQMIIGLNNIIRDINHGNCSLKITHLFRKSQYHSRLFLCNISELNINIFFSLINKLQGSGQLIISFSSLSALTSLTHILRGVYNISSCTSTDRKSLLRSINDVGVVRLSIILKTYNDASEFYYLKSCNHIFPESFGRDFI